MTQVVLPYRPVAGDPEDVSQIMADFDAIVAVVNGGLGIDNFKADSQLVPGKIAPGANRQVMETAGGAVVWGDRGVPVGVIMPFLADVAKVPVGWLLADGALISRATYADLFAVIGATYGAGDGSTTFALPNLKGRLPIGFDAAQVEFDAIGEVGGAKAVALSVGQLPSHAHGGATGTDSPDHGHGGTTGDPNSFHRHMVGFNRTTTMNNSGSANGVTGLVELGGGQLAVSTSYEVEGHQHSFNTGGANARHAHGIPAEGGGQAHSNLPPYIALNYIVKV